MSFKYPYLHGPIPPKPTCIACDAGVPFAPNTRAEAVALELLSVLVHELTGLHRLRAQMKPIADGTARLFVCTQSGLHRFYGEVGATALQLVKSGISIRDEDYAATPTIVPARIPLKIAFREDMSR